MSHQDCHVRGDSTILVLWNPTPNHPCMWEVILMVRSPRPLAQILQFVCWPHKSWIFSQPSNVDLLLPLCGLTWCLSIELTAAAVDLKWMNRLLCFSKTSATGHLSLPTEDRWREKVKQQCAASCNLVLQRVDPQKCIGCCCWCPWATSGHLTLICVISNDGLCNG